MSYFGDDRPAGWGGFYSVRHSDAAAQSLIVMLGLSEQFKLEGKVEDRNRTIGDLRAWWMKNRDSVEWASLRK